ncbi:ABC transporter substrate-binding protein [Ferrovibrio sp.]|uniref:ABC transporter substrate-binding protein n=1 Tax=Ferrovibrio sp. TaxID=1917215 RepID=UPI003D2BE83A
MLKCRITAAALASLPAIFAAAPALAQYSDNAIVIGVLTDQGSVYSDASGTGSIIAARMAVEEFGGKVNGVPVELVSADHQNKPDVGSAIARQWFDKDRVDVIADLPTSSVALAVQELAKQKGKVSLVSGAATTALTGKACSPTGFMWTYDTYAFSVGTARAVFQEGGKSWFFITADYAFGHAMQADVARLLDSVGGKIVGEAKHPLNSADFSSFLLQAQSSKADVIGLANAGGDTSNALKQAAEFDIGRGKQRLVPMVVFINDVHSMGLRVAQGLNFTTSFYWDRTPASRAWAAEFEKRTGKKPSGPQAGTYSSVRHYLKAIEQAGTDDGAKVAAAMRAMPVNDMFAEGGKVLRNGRMVHDMYLVQVKTPQESKAPWDYYKIIRTLPGEQAFMSEKESGCPLIDG